MSSSSKFLTLIEMKAKSMNWGSACSKFNSPTFAMAKKNGGIPLGQDFRVLNTNTYTNKYSTKDVNKCIGGIS